MGDHDLQLIRKTCSTVNATCWLVAAYLLLKAVYWMFAYSVAAGDYGGV